MGQLFYIGNYSQEGCQLVEFKDEKLISTSKTNAFQDSSYLYSKGEYLYHIVENPEDNEHGYLVSYQRKRDHLHFINAKQLEGKGPCFLTMDEQRDILYVANYGDGSFEAYKREGEKRYWRKNVLSKSKSTFSYSSYIIFTR